MSFTDNHSAADTERKLSKATVKQEPNLLALETWTPPAKNDKSTVVAPEQTGTSGKHQTGSESKIATTVAPELPMRQASASSNLRNAVLDEGKNISTRIDHNIELAQRGIFAVGDVLKNFDSLYQHAAQLDLQSVYKDYESIKGDASKKQIADAELALLHSPAVILANKAMVAYDAAFKPIADATSPNSKELIEVARQSMAVASQDEAVQRQFADQTTQYEALVKKHNLDAPAAPVPGPAPRSDAPAKPAPAADRQTEAPSPPSAPDTKITDSELTNLANAATAHESEKTAAEQKLWGKSTDDANAAKYLVAKANVYNILNGMDDYTPQQRQEFQSTFLRRYVCSRQTKVCRRVCSQRPELA